MMGPTRYKNKVSIALIVIAAIVSVVSILVAATGFAGYSFFSKRELGELRSFNAIQTDQASTALAPALWNFDRIQIEQIMESFMRDRRVFSVMVKSADSENSLLVRSRDGGWNSVAVRGTISGDGLYSQERDIVYNGKLVGMVRVAVTTLFLKKSLDRIRSVILFAISTAALLLTLALYLILWIIAIKPVRSLEQYALRVIKEPSDNSDMQPAIQSARYFGELESLRSSVLEMVSLLKTRYDDLRRQAYNLGESEAFRKRIFDSSRVPIVIMDAATLRYIDCNSAAVEIYRFTSREEVLGREPMDFSAPVQYDGTPSAGKARHYIERATKEGAVVFEWRHQRPDGDIWDAEVHLMSFDSAGRKLLQFTLLDITKREQAERAFKESEAKYHTLFDVANDAIFLMEQDRFVECNERTVTMFGASREIILGHSPVRFSPAMQPDGISSNEKAGGKISLALAGKPQTFEWQHSRLDGTLFDAEVSLTRIEYLGKIQLLAIVRDITGRKQAEEELRERESRLRATFESSRDAIGVSKKGVHVYANPAYLELFGFKNNDQILGTPLINCIAPSYRELMVQRVKSRAAGVEIERFYESRGVKTDGTEFDAEFSVSTYTLHGEIYSVASIRDITERKRVEKSLQESEEKYRTLIDSANEGILVAQDGMLKFVNRQTVALTGYAENDLLSRLFTDFIHPDDRRSVAEYHLRRMKGESEPYRYTFRMLIADGSVRWIENNSVLIDWRGTPASLNFLNDITERTRAENALQAAYQQLKTNELQLRAANQQLEGSQQQLTASLTELQESEERYRRLLESVTGYVYTVDIKDGRSVATRHGQGCVSVTGYQPEDFGRDPYLWLSMVHDDDRVLVFSAVERVLREKSQVSLEHRITHKNGTTRWMSTTLVPHTDMNGIILSYDGLISDVTERKLAEEARAESEERFRQMAENIEEVFFLYEKKGDRPLYISPVVESIFGVPAETLRGDRTLLDRSVHPEDAPHVNFVDPERFYSRPLNEEFRVRRPDGQWRWLRLRSFLINDDKGNVVRVAGLAADITKFKEAQEQARQQQLQLIQADKMASLGVMVSGIAHEINNPNNFITMSLPLLRQAWESVLPIVEEYRSLGGTLKIGSMEYDEFMRNFDQLMTGISDGSQRIKRIVADLKDYARIDATEMNRVFDLNEAARSAVNLMNNMIRKRTRAFSLTLSADALSIKGNMQRLEQVIINLLHNACDALTSSDQAISLTTMLRPDGYISMVLADQGCGIPADTLSKIFDPFYTTKRDSGGTGLGLSISASIVKDHGGELQYESAPGKGTTVTLLLPAAGER